MNSNQFTQLTSLIRGLDGRIQQVEEHLKKQDQHLEDQDLRLNAFIDAVGERFEQVDERFGRIEAKVDKLDVKIGRLENKVDSKADGGVMYDKLNKISYQIQEGQSKQSATEDRHRGWISQLAIKTRTKLAPEL